MNNAKLPASLLDRVWRRKLTDAERLELRALPEAAAELEMESRLSELLAKTPDLPVPSNFTSRVMQAVEAEEARNMPHRSFRWNWHAFLPRVAVTAAVVLFAGLTMHHYELASRRHLLARNVAMAAGSQPLPSVEALKNFDAIQRMSQPRADQELLALMK